MNKTTKIIAGLLILLIGACTYDFPEDTSREPNPGTADFSKLVTVGNSLTAGFMDGALYNRGQKNSFANILGQQLKLVGGGEFNQPDINSEHGFLQTGPNGEILGHLKLVYDANGQPLPRPIFPGDPLTPYQGDRSQLNNFGVPGARVWHSILSGYGQSNPHFGRFASSENASLIGDASNAGGSFFVMWLGNNDVLQYATSGAIGATEGLGEADMTSVADFSEAYNAALNEMLSVANSKGMVINIPNVTDIPYFTTIPYNSLPLDEATATQLNAGYEQNVRAGITAVAIRTVLIPAIITEGVKLSQVIPGVIREAIRISQVVPAVVTEGARVTQIAPAVWREVIKEHSRQILLAEGASEEEAEAGAEEYVNSEAGQAQIQSKVQDYLEDENNEAFDNINAAIDAQMASEEVQAQIQAQIDAYLANPDDPAFAQIDAAVDAQMANNPEVIAGIEALTSAYITAYNEAANDEDINSPQATEPFTQDQFDQITAAVADQMANSVEVAAGISAFTEAFVAAYNTKPSNPVATPPFTQDQFNQVLAQVNFQLENSVELQQQIDAQVNALKQTGELPTFVAGINPLLIDDPNSQTGFRLMKENELVTFIFSTVSDSVPIWLEQGRGIPDQYILTEDEIAVVEQRVTDFNNIISAAANANSDRVGFVDINSIFYSLAKENNPSSLNGIGANATISPPFGLFSLDGVHPNGRGSAFIANKVIEAINSKFSANIPKVNENDFHGNDLPE